MVIERDTLTGLMSFIMDSIFKIGLGLFLFGYGTSGIIRKRIELGIGGGISGGRPLGTVVLTGIPGLIFSIACIIGGILLCVPLGYAFITNQPTNTLLIQMSSGIGLAVAIIGFFFAAVIQLALSFGSSKKENDDS